jgi:S-(hydroxymethyl)glutathione dehydrogenase/alcohol dehydrogenase
MTLGRVFIGRKESTMTQTKGAIIRPAPGKLEVVDPEVDDPREGEIQVEMAASGMCHSDDPIAV